MRADRPALANAYRSGMINETNNLDRTAIIDCRGPDPGLFHDAYRAFAVRARLEPRARQPRQPAHLGGTGRVDRRQPVRAERLPGRWTAGSPPWRRTTRNGTLAQKIARDKPSDLTDRCYDGSGHKLSDGLCPAGVVNVDGTPRTVAGDAITTDANKCQLKPLNRSDDYGPIAFTDAQWARMQTIFPDGVCDFSKPGVDAAGDDPLA